MERASTKAVAKHWRWEKDRDGLAWLTFDKQGESANTFSREALNELSMILDEIKRQNYHITNTAKALGLERSHLYKKCQQLGIDLRTIRP